MADTKISDLTPDAAPVGADLIPFVDMTGPTTEHVTITNLTTVILADHIADTTDAHDASAISVADAGTVLTATEVEAALQEIAKGGFAVNVVATSGATETLAVMPMHKVTMDQNCLFTFMTPPTAGFGFLLHILGAFTPSFPGSVDWDAGTPPTYADDSLYQFVTDDTGTTWYGSLISSALA
jgi:hypothetical protein